MRNQRLLTLPRLLLLPFLPLLAWGGTQDRWAQFLSQPNARNHRALAQALQGCNNPECAHQIKPSSQAVNRLLELVQRGDPKAVDLAFLSIRFLDGGDLEDVFRGLGSVTETDPKLFLEQVVRHRVSRGNLESLLTMLPLSTVDNVPKKRRLVERRIRSLAAVKDKPVAHVRDEAIAILEHFLSRLSS